MNIRNVFLIGLVLLSVTFWYFAIWSYAPQPSSSSSSPSSDDAVIEVIHTVKPVCKNGNDSTEAQLTREDQEKKEQLEERLGKQVAEVNKLARDIPLRIVVIDTPETHPNLRNLVGSVHRYYTPHSAYDEASDADHPKHNQDVRITVYGTRLNSVLVHELLLWKNVDYVDIWSELLKATPMTPEGQPDIDVEKDYLNSVEYWRPFVINHALRHHQKVLYLDSHYMLNGKLDDVDRYINLYGSYFAQTDGESSSDGPKANSSSSSSSKQRCNPSVQGYITNGHAHKNYIIPLTRCTAKKCVPKDLGILWSGKQDGEPILDINLKALECQPLQSFRKQQSGDKQEACFIHTREDILLLPTQIVDNAATRDPSTVPARSSKSEYKTHIAIGMPSTSKGAKGQLPQNLPVFSILIPSLLRTINRSDDKSFFYRMYIAFDEGDSFYDNAANQKATRDLFDKLTKDYPMELHFIRVVQTWGWTTYLWNVAFQAAMDDGCDYFYQVNDDLKFISSGWADHFVDLLTKNPVRPNLGVVGPRDRGNPSLFTQSFVHRTHYKIFGYLYPPTFKNWYSDDWMTQVYRATNSAFATKKEVHNTNSVGTRYVVCGQEGKKRLASSKRIGERWIESWIKDKK